MLTNSQQVIFITPSGRKHRLALKPNQQVSLSLEM